MTIHPSLRSSHRLVGAMLVAACGLLGPARGEAAAILSLSADTTVSGFVTLHVDGELTDNDPANLVMFDLLFEWSGPFTFVSAELGSWLTAEAAAAQTAAEAACAAGADCLDPLPPFADFLDLDTGGGTWSFAGFLNALFDSTTNLPIVTPRATGSGRLFSALFSYDPATGANGLFGVSGFGLQELEELDEWGFFPLVDFDFVPASLSLSIAAPGGGGTDPDPAPVPEPGVLVLVALGIGLSAHGRFRRLR
ncbi:MAG: PEP-CTERM sorting domain-containing protein [Acidobacteria bacterium]|nr:PEP-CTERM sorting domain-containing protein [Acidobacteriota bacterium]